MEAITLVNYSIPNLKPEDSFTNAVELMDINNLKQLPIVENGKYLGMASIIMLENNLDKKGKIGDILPEYSETFAKPNQHVIELLNTFFINELDMIAIVDEGNSYKGVISKNDIFHQVAELFGHELGAILVLEINDRDYSLAEIARLIESNDTKILSSFFYRNENLMGNYLVLKLNRQNVNTSIATLERFGYEISGIYANDPIVSIEKEHYDMLIKYLEI